MGYSFLHRFYEVESHYTGWSKKSQLGNLRGASGGQGLCPCTPPGVEPLDPALTAFHAVRGICCVWGCSEDRRRSEGPPARLGAVPFGWEWTIKAAARRQASRLALRDHSSHLAGDHKSPLRRKPNEGA